MVVSTPFSASDSFMPSNTSPSKARRNPPLMPFDNTPTSRPVKTSESFILTNSPSNAATIEAVPPNVASKAAIWSCSSSISAICAAFLVIGKCCGQILQPRAGQGRGCALKAQQDLQFHRRQPPERRRGKLQLAKPCPQQARPVDPLHPCSGRENARASSSAAARAAPIGPPPPSTVRRSTAVPCQPPPRNPAPSSARTSRVENRCA